MKTFIAVVLLGAMCLPMDCLAQWQTKEGTPIPESGQVKSQDGFSAMLVMTPDANWRDEWDKPPEQDPHFTTSHSVSLGKELNILVILSNPALGPGLLADVECDFSVQRPDGRFSIDQHGLPCFKTEVPGNPDHLYMTTITLKFLSEASDQKGEYKVGVTLHDRNRGASIALSDSFMNE